MLAERADKEVSDITAILTELERAIRDQLDDPDYQQGFLPGLAPAEQEQFERNVDALRRRLREIPGEIEKETEAIRAAVRRPAAPDVPGGGDVLGAGAAGRGRAVDGRHRRRLPDEALVVRCGLPPFANRPLLTRLLTCIRRDITGSRSRPPRG